MLNQQTLNNVSFAIFFCRFFFKYRAVILNLNNETTPGLSLWLENLMKVFFGCDISSTSKFPRHEFSVCSSDLNMLDLMVGPLVWNIGDQIIGCNFDDLVSICSDDLWLVVNFANF
ncbi:unnamed protein product [Rhizophagus irregularis]|nr:unnamed protein product [Rhizophagus irregularis]CAB5381665.1 unnamed protein product [Rhizophagus irregularis]